MHRLRHLLGLAILLGAALGAWWFVSVLRHLGDRPGLALQVEFRDARGLRAGADVRYRGVRVGVVRSVDISGDGNKSVIGLLLDPPGAAHACVNSSFWIVTPRFSGLTGGATGLDTLVRDAYISFRTPDDHGSPLMAGSLLAGREKPVAAEPDALEDIEHGDLLMTLLVPENHGLRPGSAVVFRGMQTGDVRSVDLAPDGTHIEVQLRIGRRFRQTVTDRAEFWVARPYVSGALFSGFTVTDMSALVSPYVSYYSEAGKGVLVQDGYRAAAQPARPNHEVADVPASALRQEQPKAPASDESIALARIVYAAVEKDTFSADDPVHFEGSGLFYFDRAGRAVVVTARSLVDGTYTVQDAFGGDPEIADEQIKVRLGDGSVLRAGRVWVDPNGADLAVLVLEDVPRDISGTAVSRLHLQGKLAPDGEGVELRRMAPDGATSVVPLDKPGTWPESLGAAVSAGNLVFAIYGRSGLRSDNPAVVSLELLPNDLRPQ
ncbi:MAG: MCE family protein [Planctomycetes bacterium]|nr:MCE family protein [Planctomycetota bacterium]